MLSPKQQLLERVLAAVRPGDAGSRGGEPLLADGGIGTSLLPLLTAQMPCVDLLNQTDPASVETMHHAFVSAGARLLTTNTFCCDPDSLAGTGAEPEALCAAGARLARKVAERAHQKDVILVAGSIGPGWRYPSAGQITTGEIHESTYLRARGLISGGVDLLWLETVQDQQQAAAAVAGCRRAIVEAGSRIPLALLASLHTPETLLGGQGIAEALARLKILHIELFGLNCSLGPASLRPALDWMKPRNRKPLACCPNAGPSPEAYLGPAAWAEAMAALQRDYAPAILGGCCGVTPAHISALKTLLQKQGPAAEL